MIRWMLIGAALGAGVKYVAYQKQFPIPGIVPGIGQFLPHHLDPAKQAALRGAADGAVLGGIAAFVFRR